MAAERGHKVVLFEAAAKLGGQVLLASKTVWRKDLIQIIDWREAELSRLGVDVRCNVYAEAADVLAEAPDHVFVATGGMPAENTLLGAELAISSWDILSGDVRAEQNVLICDHTGRYEAVATADMLSANGHHVTLATIDSHAATEMGYTDRIVFHKRLAAQGVSTLPYLKLKSLCKDGNRLKATLTHELTGQSQEITTDQVLLETGTDPLAEVFFELADEASNRGISDVGAMANWARNLPHLRATPCTGQVMPSPPALSTRHCWKPIGWRCICRAAEAAVCAPRRSRGTGQRQAFFSLLKNVLFRRGACPPGRKSKLGAAGQLWRRAASAS